MNDKQNIHSDNLKISFTLTKKEYKKGVLPPLRSPAYFLFALVFILIASLLSFFSDDFIISTQWPVNILIELAYYSAIFILVFVLYRWLLTYGATLLFKSSKWFSKPMTHHFSESGVHIEHEFGDTNLTWQAYDKYIFTKDMCLLFLSRSQRHIIPLRIFNDTELKEFKQLISRHIHATPKQSGTKIKRKVLLAIVITLLPIIILVSPSKILKGVAYVEWKILNTKSVGLINNKKYSKALISAEQSLKVAKEKIGPNNMRVASSLNNLGIIYHANGDYSKANSLYNKSLAIKEKHLESNDVRWISILRNSANTHLKQANYDKAIALNNRALQIQKKIFGDNNLKVATTLNALGEIYLTQKNVKKAEPLFNESLRIRENKSSKDHRDVATSLNNLAVLEYYKANYQKSEALHKRVLSIRRKNFGDNNSSVAVSLNNIAATYTKQMKYSEAEEKYNEALNIYKKIRKPNHPDIAYTIHNLAWVYDYQKKYQKSEKYYLQALKIDEAIYSPNHPTIILTLKNLVSLYRKMDKADDVAKLEARIKNLQQK